MNEQNVGNLDVEAILANEELMKRLAAKVLDIIQQKPDAGVVCQGYYCNMAKGDQSEDWKTVCNKKLDSLGMELEDGLAASVAEDYPLNAEELDQVVTEIKTSELYSGRLSRADMSRAVSKVLADNEIMRRKGSAEAMKIDPGTYLCLPCGPNNSGGASGFSWCRPCGPNSKPHIGSPSWDCSGSGPFHICSVCSPNRGTTFHGCHVCSPDRGTSGDFLCSASIHVKGDCSGSIGDCSGSVNQGGYTDSGYDISPDEVTFSLADLNQVIGELVNKKSISVTKRR